MGGHQPRSKVISTSRSLFTFSSSVFFIFSLFEHQRPKSARLARLARLVRGESSSCVRTRALRFGRQVATPTQNGGRKGKEGVKLTYKNKLKSISKKGRVVKNGFSVSPSLKKKKENVFFLSVLSVCGILYITLL